MSQHLDRLGIKCHHTGTGLDSNGGARWMFTYGISSCEVERDNVNIRSGVYSTLPNNRYAGNMNILPA